MSSASSVKKISNIVEKNWNDHSKFSSVGDIVSRSAFGISGISSPRPWLKLTIEAVPSESSAQVARWYNLSD